MPSGSHAIGKRLGSDAKTGVLASLDQLGTGQAEQNQRPIEAAVARAIAFARPRSRTAML